METWVRNLTSTSVLCILFFIFFPLSKWFLLAAFITLELVLYYINQKKNIHIFGIFIVIFIFTSYLFYPDFVAIVCMCLCSFIFHAIRIDPGKKLIMTTLLFGIHLLKKPSFDLLILLLAVFLFHLIITIIITSGNRVQLSERMKVMGVLGIAGSIMMGLIPYFASGVRNLLSKGMYSVTSLLSEGFYKEFNIAEVDEKKQERINKLTATKREGETYPYTEYMTHPYLYFTVIIILLIIFTVTIILVFKNRKAMNFKFKDKKKWISMKHTSLLEQDQNKERVVKLTPPSNIPIRMLVYKFEKEMKEIHRRKHGESFHDWLNRIHLLREEFNSTLSEIYEKARYGEKNIPKNDVKYFKDGLKKIKKQLNNQEKQVN